MKRLVMVTSGAYSDYQVLCTVEWLSDKEPRELLGLYLDAHPDQKEDYCFRAEQFVAWLTVGGFAAELDVEEFHTDDYGCADYKTDEQRADEAAFRAHIDRHGRKKIVTPFATGEQCQYVKPLGDTMFRCYLQAGHDGPHRTADED